MKEIIWNESAKIYIRSLDDKTKREIGTLLMLLQCGEQLGPPQSKSMKIIHEKAFELRIKDSKGIYRVIYAFAIKNKILIPHAFTKKSQKTSIKDIKISKKRLGEMTNENI